MTSMGRVPDDASGLSQQAAPVVVAIDDDTIFLVAAAKALTSAGMVCHTATSGAAGLRLIRECAPDLVLLDILLIGESGFTICQEIRRTWSPEELPVIMVTGLEDLESIKTAYEAGANDFLAKPLHWKHLPFRITHILKASRDITERKQIEEELRRNQAMLARTQSVAHVGSWEWEIATDTVTWSEEMFRILQRDPAAGAPSFAEHAEIYCPEDMMQLKRAVETASREGTPFAIELHPIHLSGETQVCLALGNAETDPDGKVARLFGSLQDITERKQAEEELRISEEKFTKIFQMSPDAIDFVRTTDRVSMDFNRAFTNLFGFRSEDFVEKPVLPDRLDLWVNNEDRDRLMASLKEHGQVLGFEAPLRRMDGSIFLAEIASSALEIDGEPYHLSITRDLTERKRALCALQDSEERYQRITEAITDYIYTVRVTDGHATETVHGPGCQAVTGYHENEFANDPYLWFLMVVVEDRPKVEEQAQRILAGEDPPPIEHRILHKNRTVRWVRNTFVPHRDEHGALVSYDGLIQDITGQKQAEEERRISEEKFTKIFFLCPDLITINRLEDGVYLDVNQNFEKMLGYDREEVIGRSSLPGDLGIWVEKPDRDRLMAKIHAHGEAIGFETQFRRKDGTVFTALESCRRLEINGEPCLLSVTRDITERKLVEAALRESEQKILMAQQIGHTGSWAYDLGTGKIWGSAEGLHIFGFPPVAGDFPIADIEACIPERERVHQALVALISEGQEYSLEYAINPADGSPSKLIFSIAKLEKDSQGNPLKVLGFMQDITERKQAEEDKAIVFAQLQQEQWFSKSILDSLPGIFYLYTYPELRMVLWNKQHESLLGYETAEMAGRHVTDWHLPEARAAVISAVETVMEEGQSSIEAPLIAKDGHLVPFVLTGVRFQSQGQAFLMGIGLDISDRKQAEAEKLKLQAQLLQAQKMEGLGSLAGGVAHDMNNVLGAILGMASANIAAQPVGSPAYHAFDTISQAAVRGGQMVKSLLNFARQSPTEEHELDMNAILREEVNLLERTTLAKIRLEMDLALELRPILGDASALTHAFMNLCVNAVDAMPEHGTLTLRTRNLDNDWIEVIVEDTGTGMPREVLEKAMDPFFTTKEMGKGTGLGLSMVYSTVKVHHGQIEIWSEPGQGTRVRMRFPACEPRFHPPEPAAEPQAESAQGKLNVLLVDDDELIQSTMQAILEILGHTVVTTSSGEEALAKLEAGARPDAVILDMNMPGLGGTGTLPRLRALRPTVPVLLATGRADQAALDLIAAHPHVTLLSKPFSIEELQQHLERLGQG